MSSTFLRGAVRKVIEKYFIYILYYLQIIALIENILEWLGVLCNISCYFFIKYSWFYKGFTIAIRFRNVNVILKFLYRYFLVICFIYSIFSKVILNLSFFLYFLFYKKVTLSIYALFLYNSMLSIRLPMAKLIIFISYFKSYYLASFSIFSSVAMIGSYEKHSPIFSTWQILYTVCYNFYINSSFFLSALIAFSSSVVL